MPSEAEGEKLEKELNGTGPGEAYFIKCDVTKEEDIKVSLLSRVPPIWSYFLGHGFFLFRHGKVREGLSTALEEDL